MATTAATKPRHRPKKCVLVPVSSVRSWCIAHDCPPSRCPKEARRR